MNDHAYPLELHFRITTVNFETIKIVFRLLRLEID